MDNGRWKTTTTTTTTSHIYLERLAENRKSPWVEFLVKGHVCLYYPIVRHNTGLLVFTARESFFTLEKKTRSFLSCSTWCYRITAAVCILYTSRRNNPSHRIPYIHNAKRANPPAFLSMWVVGGGTVNKKTRHPYHNILETQKYSSGRETYLYRVWWFVDCDMFSSSHTNPRLELFPTRPYSIQQNSPLYSWGSSWAILKKKKFNNTLHNSHRKK